MQVMGKNHFKLKQDHQRVLVDPKLLKVYIHDNLDCPDYLDCPDFPDCPDCPDYPVCPVCL